MKRTPVASVDKEFTYTGEIVKAFVDPATGERYIRGVATGVEEDRDGERVSKRAIQAMLRQIKGGDVKFTASHQQDWLTEIGDVVDCEIDKETDQLLIDAKLPPEGADPIADKAWATVNKEPNVGFSIGGKLHNAYHELTDAGKRRKVLDLIGLRHVTLTKHPAYQHSFAEAVAKTFDGEPDDSDFFVEDVEKDALTTGSWESRGGRNSGEDSHASGTRNAGERDRKTKQPDVEDEDTDEDEKDDSDEKLPESRHLACPNCGHEFGAPLPVDMTPGERQAENRKPDDEDSEKSTEAIMDLQKQLDDLAALVAKHASNANEQTEPTEASDAVETCGPDVSKMLAASHAEHEARFERIEKTVGEALSLIAENLKDMRERVGAIPLGRRSTARVLPPVVGHDDVGKTDNGKLDEAADAKDALRRLNERTYGIR